MSMSRITGFLPVNATFPVNVAPFDASGVSPGAVAVAVAFAASSLERLHPRVSNNPSTLAAIAVFCNLILQNPVAAIPR